ncbi:Gfo/Idh/MocA family protein [Alkalihalobacillus sp. AL-G]|uniref:Gfo/Idh/MocA family protein n=1 Tax=Alkalihalobacillus sp. AL-G TaxID=2926399 RepID=UPI002729BE5F|nr:Gfo/Idh/MocA family oxidoreductase [Alkalihalobacillus sp. AL-G]WLD94326.1 Gfo/Idh/MocA family oxidoreductase [Alkalihalobacillus sp. AL-G]
MKLGTVGTSRITNSFIEAAGKSGKLTLNAVYSRSFEKARQIADTYNAPYTFDDLEQMAKSNYIEIVYIASPNSLHYEQAKLFLQHKKHVICEKPIFSNTKEWEDAYQVAEENGVFLFEAMRNIHSPNSKILKRQIGKAGKIRSAMLHYIQYSSRYDLVLKGEEPNIFSPRFSGGALVDLGVYPTSLAVSLFGEPDHITYYPVMLRSGVDGSGTLILKYDGFICTILCSKISHSHIPSEIHGEEGSFVLDHVAPITNIKFVDRHSKKSHNLEEPRYENEMIYEVEEFVRIIKTNDQQQYEELKGIGRMVLTVTETARQQNDIVFENEK